MEKLALDGLWLVAALAGSFVAGGLLWPRVLDWLNGVPSALRTALNTAEKQALKSLSDAKLKLIADVTAPLAKAPAPAAPVAPAAVAPAAPAAPAA